MAGIGICLVKKEELLALKKRVKRSFYLDLETHFHSQKLKKQFLFTPPVQLLYALNQALDEFFQEGHHLNEERLKELLGHTPFQVVVGLGLGIAIAVLFLWRFSSY
jgi:aspartate aminotransferase-like enzyme